MHKALANRSLNLIVYLPSGNNGKPGLVMYSILDAVLSNLEGEHVQGQNAEAVIRRVIEAKRSFSECRVTLVGGAQEWSEEEKNALTVC